MTKEQRKRQIRQRVFKATVVSLAFAAAIGIGVAENNYDEKHFSLNEVVEEIDIHSGIGLTPDGHHVSPFLEHGCEVPNDGRTFEERLSDRMYEEGYDQKTIEAAVEKFNLQCEGEMSLANEINLKQIEKEAKNEKLMARGR